jgi:hypothetical protein
MHNAIGLPEGVRHRSTSPLGVYVSSAAAEQSHSKQRAVLKMNKSVDFLASQIGSHLSIWTCGAPSQALLPMQSWRPRR